MLKISCMGFSSDPDVTRYGPGIRNEYIIHYVLKGRGMYNGVPVSGGQGFLITPMSFEEYYPDMDDPWEFVWIISDDSAMGDVFKYYNADESSFVFDFSFTDKLEETKKYLIANNNRFLSRAEILKLHLKIFENHTADCRMPNNKSNAQAYVDFAVDYIKTNYHRGITVCELTHVLGVSQPYLFKIFKSALGVSPKQFITEYRLQQAKNMLRETELSVTNIANSVGFEDVLAFSKSFSKKERCAPTKYREIQGRN